jgi:SlyX protein
MKERITDIEIQLMHHENTIQQLNEVITRQQLTIDKLQSDITLILQQLRAISSSPLRDACDEEPPPHY